MKKSKAFFLSLITGIVVFPFTWLLAGFIFTTKALLSFGLGVFLLWPLLAYGVPFIVVIIAYNYFLKRQ